MAGRIAFDEHKHFRKFVKKYAASDISIDEEDDISAIVCRYILYMRKLSIREEDIMQGFIENFLTNYSCEASALERRSTER